MTAPSRLPWHDELARQRAMARDGNEHRRALVLAYPDLAKRLCDPPYSASRPENWSGYIPGPLGAENSRGVVSMNTSSVRAQLSALVAEAAHRADAEAKTARPPTTTAPTGATT